MLDLTGQNGDDAEPMLLWLHAENWDNNTGSAGYSKYKLSMSTEMVVLSPKKKQHSKKNKLQFNRVTKVLAIGNQVTFEHSTAINVNTIL